MHKRYDELDSLRGLAALAVFFGHMFLVFNESFWTNALFKFGPLRGLVAGGEAVILFFVLSGFVLSLPFYTNRQNNYPTYVIKRMCRIYIPYIVTIILAFICRELFYGGEIEGLSEWTNTIWENDVSKADALNYFFLIGSGYTDNLNFVVWSLVHEMRISLIFPIIMFFLLKANSKQGIIAALLLSFISVVFVFLTDTVLLFDTLHYSSLFIIGALLAKYRETLVILYKSLGKRNKVILFWGGLLLFIYGRPSYAIRSVVAEFETSSFYGTVIDSWFISVGASILVVFALSSIRFSKVLSIKFFKYLGKISYSLYLTHLIVMATFIHILHGYIPMWGICLISVLGTFIVSSVTYYLVEKPSMRLGAFLATTIKRKKARKNAVKPIEIIQ